MLDPSPDPHRNDDRKTLTRVVIACVLLFPLLARFGNPTDDEGFLYVSAQRVLHGAVPHLDFESIYVPGRYFVLAALFSVFGESLLVERVVLGLARAAAVVGCFVGARQLVSRNAALCATLTAAVALGPLHNIYALVPLLIVLPAIRGLRLDDPRWLAAAGLVAGITVWMRQDTAVFAGIAVCVAAMVHRPARRLTSLASFALPAVAVGGGLLVIATQYVEIEVLARQLFVAAVDEGRPSLSRMPAFEGSARAHQSWSWQVVQLLFAIVPVLAAVLGLLRARVDVDRRGIWVLWSVLVLLCCNQVFRENSLVRFLQNSVLVWPLVVAVLHDRLPFPARVAAIALPLTMFFTPITASVSGVCSAEYTGTLAMPLLRRRPFVTRGSLFFGSTRRIEQLRNIEAMIRDRALYRETVVVYPRPMAVHQLLLQRHGGPAIHYGLRTRERTRGLAEALEGSGVHWLFISMEHLDYPSDDAWIRMLNATILVDAAENMQLWAPVCDENWQRGRRTRRAEHADR